MQKESFPIVERVNQLLDETGLFPPDEWGRFGTSTELRHQLDDYAIRFQEPLNGVQVDAIDVSPDNPEPDASPLVAYEFDLYADRDTANADAKDPPGLTVYMLGGVHENEIAYRQSMPLMAELATKHPDVLRSLGIAKVVMLDANPDGTDLTTWEPTPESPIKKYFKSMIRGREQIDWTYPIEVRASSGAVWRFDATTLPGTLASQALIEWYKPGVVMPMHNSGLGSWYVYLGNADSLADPLFQLLDSYGLGPHRLMPDYPRAKQLRPGIFQAFDVGDIWEAAHADHPDDPEAAHRAFEAMGIFGGNTIGYALSQNPDSIGIIVEAAYAHATGENETATGQKLREAGKYLRLANSLLAATNTFLQSITLDNLTDEQSKIYNFATFMTEFNMSNLPKVAEKLHNAPDQELTRGERIAWFWESVFGVATGLGGAARLALALGAEQAEELDASLDQVDQLIEEIFEPQLNSPRAMAKAQIGAIALAAAWRSGNNLQAA